MKKTTYILLLVVELLAGLLILSGLWNSTSYLAVTAIVFVWVALLVRVVPKLKKAEDEALKKKYRRRLVLVMATPVIAFIILAIWFIIRFTMVN